MHHNAAVSKYNWGKSTGGSTLLDSYMKPEIVPSGDANESITHIICQIIDSVFTLF